MNKWWLARSMQQGPKWTLYNAFCLYIRLEPEQNDQHYSNIILKYMFLSENLHIWIQIWVMFSLEGSIDNKSPLVHIMTWLLTGKMKQCWLKHQTYTVSLGHNERWGFTVENFSTYQMDCVDIQPTEMWLFHSLYITTKSVTHCDLVRPLYAHEDASLIQGYSKMFHILQVTFSNAFSRLKIIIDYILNRNSLEFVSKGPIHVK